MHELLYRSEDRAQTPQPPPPPARAQLSNRNQNSKIHRNSICVTDGSHDSTIKIPWLLLILTVSHFHSLFFLL